MGQIWPQIKKLDFLQILSLEPRRFLSTFSSRNLDISAEKKTEMVKQLEAFSEPAMITISISVISPDHTQGSVFVQHFNQKLLAFMNGIAAPGVNN